MEERLVSTEVAKMLKDLGFNEYCENVVNHISGECSKTYRTNSKLPEVYCSKPTQSLAQKWLREERNLHICIYRIVCEYGYRVLADVNGVNLFNNENADPNKEGLWSTYEDALEVALKECLSYLCTVTY